MKNPETEAEHSARRATERASRGIVALGGLGIFAVIFCSILVFIIMRKNETWNSSGQIGDIFGGLLNPILTFLAFIGILLTINLQAKELRLAREESRRAATALEEQVDAVNKQNFEATFFQMLMLLNGIMDTMAAEKTVRRNDNTEITIDKEVFRGYFAFKVMFQSLSRAIKNSTSEKERIDNIRSGYRVFWLRYHQQLGHYYRYTYNMLRFIDESDIIDKKKYVRIYRSRLSDYEFVLLMYNAMTEDGKKLVFYINKFDILDNISTNLLISPDDLDIFKSLEQVKC